MPSSGFLGRPAVVVEQHGGARREAGQRNSAAAISAAAGRSCRSRRTPRTASRASPPATRARAAHHARVGPAGELLHRRRMQRVPLGVLAVHVEARRLRRSCSETCSSGMPCRCREEEPARASRAKSSHCITAPKGCRYARRTRRSRLPGAAPASRTRGPRARATRAACRRERSRGRRGTPRGSAGRA